MAATPLEEITGTVQHLKCQKPTFCAGFIHADGREVSFSVRGYVKSGDCVTLRGMWEDHPTWGRQFRAKEANVTLPTDPAGLVKWLAWNVTGVGPVIAQRLVDEFGVALMDRAASEPEVVAIAAKLPITSIEEMAQQWANEKQRVGAFTFFAGHGLTKRQCEALLETIKSGAVQLAQEDPYQFIGRVHGFGWSVVDGLAYRLHITGTDPRRLKGALAAVVREQEDEGSTATAVPTACRMAADKIGVGNADLIRAVVAGAIERGDVRRFGGGTEDTDYLATPHGFTCERIIWQTLANFREEFSPFGVCDEEKARRYAEDYRKVGAITLDDSQLQAVVNAIRFRASAITGGAGSGKTSLAKAIVKYFHDGDVPVRLAAPTGKAARRLQEVVGHPAETIHRLLEFNGGTRFFEINRQNPLRNCAVLIDEMSMCDSELFARVLDAMGAGTVLVLIGDPNQLPPVGAGAPLRDLLAHNLMPATRLEKCHRQAGPLKTNCFAIMAGKVEASVTDETPFPWVHEARATTGDLVAAFVEQFYKKWLPEWKFDPVRDAQFITAKHEGVYGTKKINLLLQRLHQAALGNPLPPPDPDELEIRPPIYPGDKVINVVNLYDLDVMNGEVGFVVAVEPRHDESGIAFDDEEQSRSAKGKPYADLIVRYPAPTGERDVIYPIGTAGAVQLAYCLSVHKVQGSQYPCCVTIVPKANAFMQHRSWLYTAVTRAQKTAVILGDPEGIRRAAERQETDRRETVLRVFARHEKARPQ